MEFNIIGKLDRSRDEIKSEIEKLGGKLVSSVHEKLAAVISTESEVEKMNEKMQKAKTFGIQVVSLKFLDEVKSGNAIKYIKTQSICDWGTDVSVTFVRFDCLDNECVCFSRQREFLRKRLESSRKACIPSLSRNQSL